MSTPPVGGGTAVILLNRARAGRLLPLLPDQLRSTLTVVTTGGDEPLPPVGRIVEVAGRGGLGGRLRGTLGWPGRRAALARAVAGACWVVCVDGQDLAAVEPLLAPGPGAGDEGRPALLPGGLRHLVDRWLAEVSRSTSST